MAAPELIHIMVVNYISRTYRMLSQRLLWINIVPRIKFFKITFLPFFFRSDEDTPINFSRKGVNITFDMPLIRIHSQNAIWMQGWDYRSTNQHAVCGVFNIAILSSMHYVL